jgi:rubredoxin
MAEPFALTCPKCGSSDSLAIVESLLGNAHIFPEVDENGRFQYAGETDVDWNSQQPFRELPSDPICAHCGCGHQWYEPRLKEGV